ncbi:Isochorismatase hydrolase [Neurospora crassa]|uniref:Isochorismatase domain-containing protein 2A n=1 Tax=Neurospora crassa (strain ATCC 24698 / 74-OR23-1A / CBS 708.71 / DSM 1257 / FGSC 987) TaxID=367110 RepID=Q7RXP2_NEUCR|nr:isochorismatase domain-containing protein 2A [Neurospora crassa OR74A]EAA27443.3 isochorismatase domain-containing protein 2A [Neurospora crassa OR74A]KHE89425.1 Isochorismatase hydrolase [Neurospora crassa]|eukprot:XP_956679.3 isochorismatase domain-containing protein 2A [Neurospora crassa OR74A]
MVHETPSSFLISVSLTMNNSVCDIQEKFRNAIYEFDKVVSTTTKLLRFAHALHIPIYVTTQTRAKLGETVSELQPFLTQKDGGGSSSSSSSSLHPLVAADLDKTLFGMYTPSLASLFSSSPASIPSHIALVGIESHICVTQTCLALRKKHPNTKIYVIADGVSSCNKEEVPVALARLRQEGVTVTTSEGWMYECMGDAGIPEFREVVKIVKETAEGTREALRALGPLGAKI